MRVAIVHDWLVGIGGGERVLESFLEMWPDATIHTLVFDRTRFTTSEIGRRTVRASFIDRLPGARRNHRPFLPLMPVAIEQIDLSGYDLVVSNVLAVAHGVITSPEQLHIAYVNRTMRYAWDTYHADLRAFGLDRGVRGVIARAAYHYLRMWDRLAFDRPDIVVCNSTFSQRRLEKHYRRDARVIHPPVAMPAGVPTRATGDRYVYVGRLVPLKHVDLIVDAFTRLRRPLLVVGDGPLAARLRAAAGPMIDFVGWMDRDSLRGEIGRSRGLILASEEDFGIVAVEAMSLGVPVVAHRSGALPEVVKDGETGILYGELSIDGIVDGVLSLERGDGEFDPLRLHEHARQFAAPRFKEAIERLVEDSRRDQAEALSGGRADRRRSV